MKNFKTTLTLLALTANLAWISPALAQATTSTPATPAAPSDQPDIGTLRALINLARSDIKNQAASLIAENLPMTEQEAAEFWPLHREYAAALTKLNDRKLALIVSYAKLHNANTMTDKDATALANEAFDIEAKKTDLKRKYFKKFRKVIPATKAARFFQVENQITLALDLQVAASIPLIK